MTTPKTAIWVLVILPCFLLFFSACDRSNYKTEARLLELRDSLHLDLQNAEPGGDQNALRQFSREGIEYGIIFFPNRDTVKYWFMSHHLTTGKGGTLFEMPDGNLNFIAGYFCCEVQLPNEGKFADAESFLARMQEVDGLTP